MDIQIATYENATSLIPVNSIREASSLTIYKVTFVTDEGRLVVFCREARMPVEFQVSLEQVSKTPILDLAQTLLSQMVS